MSSINPEKWHEVKEIFYAALQRAPEEREQFLNQSCAGDDHLRREVELLLSSSEAAGSFMQSPAVGEIAEAIAGNKEKLLVNQTLRHYKILKLLGVGGMGEVYLAEDTRLERKVALKVLPSAFAEDAERMRRFVREAKAASALNHPNILTIYETGETDNTNYIASEYVEGETLTERLRRESLSLKAALDAAVQITSALQAAHGAKIVHRDIKPDNVMIRPDGVVKLLDFGIAKLTEKKPKLIDAEDATAIKTNTTPGMIIGTANYMSPEQARGQKVDARSDIFSFGLVLYEMLSGKRAFAGENAMDIISSILQKEPVPLSQLMPDVPREIERIVGKASRKDRDERYQTAKDLLIDLKDARQELEFQNKLERTAAPNREQAETQIINAVTNDSAQTTTGTEYIAAEIKNHKLAAIAALLVLLVGGAALYYFTHSVVSNKQTSSDAINSIAVLPFENASQDANAEYLSDGITESLINRLSQLSNLKVMSRSAVFSYKGKEQDANKIGGELNVRAVLTGSIKQIGDQIVITVRLEDAQTNQHIWGEQYARKFADILNVQNEIAQQVSANLRLKLTGADEQRLAKRYTDNVEAYQLYLKGNYKWEKHTLEDLQQAIEYYNEAIEKDPNYALAFSGLASCYGRLGNSYLPPREAFPKAKAYAAKALELDETLAEAQSSMAAVRLFYDWNWTEAEKEIRRALVLNPNYAHAHDLYAIYLGAMGRPSEAVAQTKRAQELDPLSLHQNTALGEDYYYARQYDQAITQLEKTIDLDPHYYRAYLCLGRAYEQKKMYEQAIKTFQDGMSRAQRHPQLISSLGHAYALAGERNKAAQALAELREMSKQKYISPYLFAVVYVSLGDKDQALAWLEKAYQDRSVWLIWLKVEPRFDSLRSDPRFQDLMRRIGLQS
ncbi:MAG: protein kinase [Acidobacteria bacterium]|nr:protein kinase [Acidobacteriota bacterium]MCA1639399.1 protein kinase [Acidobacteriota bacterium]